MRSIPLHSNLPDKLAAIDQRTEASAIQAELAVRILELRKSMGDRHVSQTLEKWRIIWTLYPPAFWVLMHLMTGDLSEITASYTDLGKLDAKTKQAVQQEWECVLKAIAPHYPLLSDAIIQLRVISAKLSEGENK